MPPQVVTLARGYLLFIPLTLVGILLVAVLQAQGYRFNLVRTAVHVVYTALLLFLWLLGLVDPFTVVIASLAANAATVLLALYLVHRKGWWSPEPALGAARELLSFGYRVHIGTLASTLASRLDLVMLAAFVPAAELGNYAISAIPGAALTLLSVSASLVVYPAVVKMSPDAVPSTIARCVALFGFMILLAFIVALALPSAIPIVFGPGYERAVPIGQILTFGAVVRSNTGLLGTVVRGLARPLASGAGDIVGLPIFATLLIVMVPTWRGVGAAIALSLAAGISFAVMLGLCMRIAGMSGLDLGRLLRRDGASLRSLVRSIWAVSADA
jgi:O-antigen/teichoic acid export membrane protein